MVDEQYVRILQRYKELLRNAGNMDDDDMKVNHYFRKKTPVF